MDNTLSMDGSLTTERSQFIMKVYGLLTLSLLSCLGGGVFGGTCLSTMRLSYMPLLLICLLSVWLVRALRHVPGLNLVVLFGFTFIQGAIVGPLLFAMHAQGFGPVIAEAGITTFGTFAALTAYVFWSKTDFSYLRGFVFAGLMALIISSVFGWLFGMGAVAHLAMSYVGVLVFVGFILYDTSNIIRKFPTNEYVIATLELFLDILNLFLYILDIFMSRERR